MKKSHGFSLIECLIVIAIIALLMAITLPCLGRARLQAKTVTVDLELRQIGIALDLYMDDNNRKCPPTRKDCSLGWQDHLLPPELAEGGYLPKSSEPDTMPVGIEDRFYSGQTYRYWAVGDLVQNGALSMIQRSTMYVPPGFPDTEGAAEDDILYKDPKMSPVTWVVYSVGPNYDDDVAFDLLKVKHGPVARRSWFSPSKKVGFLTRLRLRKGRQTGTFEMKGLAYDLED